MRLLRSIHAFPAFFLGIVFWSFYFDLQGMEWMPTEGRARDKKGTAMSEYVDLDPTATLAADIEWIGHDAAGERIVLQLAANRTCHHPVFLGRLSGPALATLTWETTPPNNDHQVIGAYQVPLLVEETATRYNIEIIAERCQAIAWHENFINNCLEDVHRHRVTLPNATIHVKQQWQQHPTAKIMVQQQQDQELGRGMWKHKANFPPNITTPALLTRVQPEECMPKRLPKEGMEPCRQFVSLDRFNVYDFHWNNATQQAIENMAATLVQRQMPPTNICFYGASHSRELTKFSKIFVQRSGISNVEVTHLYSRTAEDLFSLNLQKACHKVVIGVGQWQAGWPWSAPTLFPEYRQMMQSVAQFAVKHNDSRIEFYFRSMHRNPMGAKISSCPPTYVYILSED